MTYTMWPGGMIHMQYCLAERKDGEQCLRKKWGYDRWDNRCWQHKPKEVKETSA